MKKSNLAVLVEGSIVAALAMALEYVPHGSDVSFQISFGVAPIILFSLRRGLKPGMTSGLIWGILDLLLRGVGGGGVLNPLQGFLEYFVAFAVVGLAGLGYSQIQTRIKKNQSLLATSIYYSAIGVFSKYFVHFVAGVIFWGSYAPKGSNPWIYSLAVNGGSGLSTFIYMVILLTVLSKSLNRILKA